MHKSFRRQVQTLFNPLLLMIAAWCCVLVVFPHHGYAQSVLGELDLATDQNAQTVFAPFVNRIRIATKDSQVRITWEDIPNFDGSYRIYRHDAEITNQSLAAATIAGEVPSGEQFFTDLPPASGNYFYAVLALSREKQAIEVFIPFRNKTLNPVAVTVADDQQAQFTEITSINAQVQGQTINLAFNSSINTRTVTAFRSTSPIQGRDDLAKAIQINSTSGRTIVILDTAVPGVAYYYAAVDTEAWQRGVISLVVGQSSLDKPVEIPLVLETFVLAKVEGKIRNRLVPLPILSLQEISPEISGLQENFARNKVELTPALMARIKALQINLIEGRGAARTAELLPSDKLVLDGRFAMPVSGESRLLLEILEKHFTRGDFKESIKMLKSLLTLPLSAPAIAKGRFYLGQALYLDGKYKEAIPEFLIAQDQLEDLVDPWINSSLSESNIY